MNAAASTLPDDIDALKQLVVTQQQRISVLEEYIRLYKSRQFGASSEQAPGQHELFNEAEAASHEDDASTESAPAVDTAATSDDSARRRGYRKPLPAELPRVRIEHDLDEADKRCTCGCERVCIGEETSEQLDIIPAQIRVLVQVRKQYACRACEEGVITAALPPQPIPKSNASPGLLAHVAVAKYQDALPLHRQEHIFGRLGLDLPRHTLARWMLATGELLQPLLNLMNDELLQAPVIQCDETPVQVLKEPDKTAQSQSYMWVRTGGPPQQRIILYEYHPTRAGEVARRLLADYRGYLQTDDYAGYHAVGRQPGIIHLGCWAHARRKFVEAQQAAAPAKGGKSKQPPTGKADMALNYIGKLYGIERALQDKSAEQRQAIRQQDSLLILAQLRTWLDKALGTVLPKGALGRALQYLDNNWDKLVRYTEDGRLNIDNNAAENAIRPFVIGRKNWLFSDTPAGARASAALYSVIETAKANGLEPYAYLRKVLGELPAAARVEDIEALLPWRLTMAQLQIS
jgi:transposase